MYLIEKPYLSLMYACKHNKNKTNIKHCVAKITGMSEEDVDDSCMNIWLSRAVEEFRPYSKSIQNQGLYEMCEYIDRYEYLYKPNFTNEYQRVNQWMIHLLRGLSVRKQDQNGVWVEKYGSKLD